MRRYSNRTPLTTRSRYSELGVERLTNVLGRHAEMFRARDSPGNALGQTMHRRSRCAIFREHMRSAPREALDPGQGEAMLGQALHEKPALRFSECSGQD